MFGFSPNKTSSQHQYEEASISLKNKVNEVEEEIPDVECKSLQGDYMGEEREDECTPNFFVWNIHITTKDVGSCKGGETYFRSDTK